jgi:hypothetical protein
VTFQAWLAQSKATPTLEVYIPCLTPVPFTLHTSPPSPRPAPMSTTSSSQSQDKALTRPYKCPYPECARAFSRLEHQVFPSPTTSLLINPDRRPRLATSVHTPGRSHSLVLSPDAKNVSLALMS